MPSVPDTSHLPWWLGPTESPSDALLKGVQAGSAIASNILRAKQIAVEAEGNLRREETATKFKYLELAQQAARDSTMIDLKRMDLGLEAERNDISKQTQNMKMSSDIAKGQGILEMGNYVGESIRKGLLLDPDRQAGLWELAAKNPLVPRQMVESFEGAFKEARDRKARAETGEHATISEKDFLQWQKLKAISNNAPDGEAQINAEEELRVFERMKNIGEIASGPPKFGEDFGLTKVNGSEQMWSRNPKTGAVTFKALPKTGIAVHEQQKIEYAGRVKALEDAFRDRSLRSPDGKRADYNEFQRQLDSLNSEFREKAKAPSGTTESAPATAPNKDPLGLFK